MKTRYIPLLVFLTLMTLKVFDLSYSLPERELLAREMLAGIELKGTMRRPPLDNAALGALAEQRRRNGERILETSVELAFILVGGCFAYRLAKLNLHAPPPQDLPSSQSS